ncbi:hypothetical protein [Halorubrum sp. DTA98]|uniref:hypothetical protein n=1 Tax=Halorubrum sp. DTA98 TaxID=3402163 RepID=UPI003AAD58A4
MGTDETTTEPTQTEQVGTTLLDELLSVTTAAEVEELLDRESLAWQPLGDQENNVGIVRSGSSPSQALAERMTNGIDAVIERAVTEGTIPSDLTSPREAVRALYDLDSDEYSSLSATEVREKAEDTMTVRMLAGSGEDHLTIETDDEGIGQRPDAFPKTFLSLNEDGKITKPYLIGKYGQGGSNTFDFCEYAIIISQAASGGDIGWSIVRFNERLDGTETYSDGVFEYCIRPNGQIPRIDAAEAPDWNGSTVRLVDYQASEFSNSLSPSRKSLYTVANRAMFGSLFPFILEDTRHEEFDGYDGKPKRRTIVGSRYRLDGANDPVYRAGEFTRIEVGNLGELRVKYWVLKETGAVSQFVDQTHPVVFTLHGQRHHAEPKRFLQQTDYSFLKDRLVVEVDCERLSQPGKRVFSSTRDRATEGEEYHQIKTALRDAFENHDELETLNEEFRERALNESSSEQEEKTKDLLAKLLEEPDPSAVGPIKTDGSGADGGDGGGSTGGDGGVGPVEPLYETPQIVAIDNSADPLQAHKGRVMRLRVKIDAVDAFEKEPDHEIRLEVSDNLGEALTYNNETALKDGWKRYQLAVDENASLGETGEITVTTAWPRGNRSDTRSVEIASPPNRSGSGGRAQVEAPEIRHVQADDTGMRESAGLMDDDAVAEYMPDSDGPGEVFIAMFNETIEPLRATNDTERTVEQYDRQYAAYMAFNEVMRHREQEEMDGEQPGEGYVKREQNRVAATLMRSITGGLNPDDLGVA